MKSFTRPACCSVCGFLTPITCVLTGPSAGNNSLYACDWNCVTASARTGCVAQDAPWKGTVLFSYLNPKRSKPVV